MKEDIVEAIKESIEVKKKLLENEELILKIIEVSKISIEVLEKGGRLFFCGNGGSFSDAQHISGELLGKFYYDREPLNGEVLGTNLSYLTAVSNDYSYDEVFSRELSSKGRKGDLLFAISTSGNSKNIIKAVEKAKEMDIKSVCLTGESGGKLKDLCDYLINVPSKDTPRIQETHILIGHILSQLIEKSLMNHKKNY